MAQTGRPALRTVEGDMRDLSAFREASFDLVFHPVSNVFCPEIRPVWREAYPGPSPGRIAVGRLRQLDLFPLWDPYR